MITDQSIFGYDSEFFSIEPSVEAKQMSTLMAQEGMRVPGEAPPQEAANGPASGVIGGENATPAETVADDIPMDVPEGSFIINAAAAEVAGYGDIKTMIMDAIGVARRLGVEISTGDEQVSDEEAVDLLVSKGEVYIEPTLAKIIGYDVLEKINNRGKREVARRQKEAEAKQQQEPQQAPQPQMAQTGGFIANEDSPTPPSPNVEDPPDRPPPDMNMEPELPSSPPVPDEIEERAKTANDNLHDFLVSAFRKEKYEKLVYDGPFKIKKFKKNHVEDYRGTLNKFRMEQAMKDWFDDNPELANDLLKGHNQRYRNSPEYQLKDTFFSSGLTKLRGALEDQYDSAAYFLSGLPIAQNKAKLQALRMTGEGYSYSEIPSILSKEGRVTDFDPRLFSRKPLINPETGKEYVEKQGGGFVKKKFADGGETKQEFPDYIKKYFMPEIDYHLETIRSKTVARNQYGEPTTAYTEGVRRGDKIYEIPTYDRKGGILSRAEVEASLDSYIEKYGDFGIPQSEYKTLMEEKEAFKEELYSKDNRFKVPEDAITQKIVLPEKKQQDSRGFIPKK